MESIQLNSQRDDLQRQLLQVCGFANNASLQIGLALFSVLFLLKSLVSRNFSFGQNAKPEVFIARISILYETSSQIARAGTFAAAFVEAIRNPSEWPSALLFGYVFVLGLLSLLYKANWRRQLLGHVNLLLAAALVLLLISDIVPQAILDPRSEVEPPRVLLLSTLTLSVLVALFTPQEWAPPSVSWDLVQRQPTEEPNPEETCSAFSYHVSYGWLTNLMLKGFKRNLAIDDLPSLPYYDEPLLWLPKIQRARKRGGGTLWTLVILLRKEVARMVCYSISTAMAELIAPFAMYQLLGYLANPDDAVVTPVVWVCLLFVGPVLRSISAQSYIFTTTRLVVRVKISLIQELFYREVRRDANGVKPETLPPAEIDGGNGVKQKESSKGNSKAGQIANLMSYDIDAITSARDIVLSSLAGPLELALSMTLLYRMLGWASMVGLLVMLLCFPLPGYFARKMSSVHTRAMKATDTRLSRISEYLPAIRTLKYFGWETAISEKIDEARQVEQQLLWKRSMCAVAITASGNFIPLLTLLVMFSCYVLGTGKPLTSAIAFTSLSLVEILRTQFVLMSEVTRNSAQAKASLRRIDQYFESSFNLKHHPVGPPSFKNATLSRSQSSSFKLLNISLDFNENGLNVVTGPSGSGKTSLLLSLLGESILEAGEVTCPRDVAFASQTAWLQHDTIRNNIIFYGEFEQARYDVVVNACCLNHDLDQLPNGDLTQVGENGIVLSGGQRQRVALARALYSKAPLILLDDVFSALDVTTAVHVYNHCFCSDLLQKRTIILVTQLPWIGEQADFEVKLDGGEVVSAEAREDVLRIPVSESRVLATSRVRQPEAGNMTPIPHLGQPLADLPPNQDLPQGLATPTRNTRALFYNYMIAFGGRKYAIWILFTAFIAQLSFFAMTLWLSIWVGAYSCHDSVNVGFYLGIYAAVVASFNLLTGLNVVMFQNGAWNVARKMHIRLVKAVLGVSLSWYDTISIGRITNRFSRDISSLDSLLGDFLQRAIDLIIRLVLRIGAIGSIMPIFAVPTAFVCVIGVVIGDMYTRTASSVKRIASESQSPVFAHFSEVLAGLSVVRARAGMQEIMGRQLAQKLRIYARAAEVQFNCNRWVSIRSDVAAATVAVGAGTIALWRTGSVSAGLVGFSLTNAIGLGQTIIQLVRKMNDLEVELTCFQRVEEYADLPPEEETATPAEVAATWPSSGTVEFRNVTVRYTPEGPDILKNLSFTLKSGERVAIVGRTGSGKSTLVLSLLRVTHVVSGSILYDGIDITNLPLQRLRQSLTIIPQDTVLFSGDVAENLDPANISDRHDLENALVACSSLRALSNPSSNNDPNDLSSNISLLTHITTSGGNFSHGQRQILGLARALVKRSKLILLDEATASMDYETDKGIQRVLREELKGSTLITIAHRLRTIIDYDRVIVMSAGQIMEMGRPKELFERNGMFAEMVKHGGEAEELVSAFEV